MPIDPLKYYGNRVRTVRKEQNLTQKALAKKTGMSLKAVQDIEHGRKNSMLLTMILMSEALGIPATSFFQAPNEVDTGMVENLVEKLQMLSPEHQKVLLETMDCLMERLRGLERQDESHKQE